MTDEKKETPAQEQEQKQQNELSENELSNVAGGKGGRPHHAPEIIYTDQPTTPPTLV
jgi:bacteriocin-like protein